MDNVASAELRLSQVNSKRDIRQRPAWQQFLLQCSGVCGCPSKDQRTVRAWRKARNRCAQFQKDPANADLSSLPLEHLRAAEHHLAALERWLQGHSPTGFDDLTGLINELGSTGLAHEEDADVFTECFHATGGEMLVKALPCLALSGALSYPGKLYLSSVRLCFHASVLGVVVSFACPWTQVAQVRLTSQDTVKTHPVRVSLKASTDFGGTSVEKLSLRLFDLEALGYFDKCASFFTGSGLFGIWQQSTGDQMSATMTERANRVLARARTASSPASVQAQLEQECTIWELQRRVSIWSSSWHRPFLPHDGQKKQKWMILTEAGYAPHPYLAMASLDSPKANSKAAEPPIEAVNFLGHDRACTWRAVVDANSDAEGWQYAVDFYSEPEQWTPYSCSFSHVRRRKWYPIFTQLSLESLENFCAPSQEMARIVSDPVSRANTTILADKGLHQSQVEVVTSEIGAISLESLGQALESEDWKSPGQLMAMYFEEVQAEDLEVHEWTSLAGVHGKARSIDMRVPVPPAPMCPKETRCQSTWHVSVSKSKVVLESVTMSIDVPYGTSFNVVVCDTFTCSEGSDQICMVRSCALDWVSSIWLKKMVEQNVPIQIKAVGERWVGVLKRWVQANAA